MRSVISLISNARIWNGLGQQRSQLFVRISSGGGLRISLSKRFERGIGFDLSEGVAEICNSRQVNTFSRLSINRCGTIVSV